MNSEKAVLKFSLIASDRNSNHFRYNLKNIFTQLQNYLYANSNISRNERLGQELLKIIISKHFDEKWKENIFPTKPTKDILDKFPIKLKTFFGNKVSPYLHKSGISDKKEEISLDDKSLQYVGQIFSNLTFLDNPIDSLGAAFEVFAEGSLAGDLGQYFTPLRVVRTCIHILSPSINEKIIDPACGSGGFLNYALRYISNYYKEDEKKLDNYLKNCLFGIDKDPDLIKIAKGFALIMDANLSNFMRLDSLKIPQPTFDERYKRIRGYIGKFDIVITNPPFGSKLKIRDREILKEFDFGYKWNYDKRKGEWIKTNQVRPVEPQVLFLELCLKLLKENGRLAIVLPDGIFGNPTAGWIRQYILSQSEIIAIIDCPQDTFMPHTHTKTSLLFLKKTDKSMNNKIFMARVKNCGNDSRGSLVVDQHGHIIEDFSTIIKNFKEFKEGIQSESELGYIVKRDELINNILIPKFYDYEVHKRVENFKKNNKYISMSLDELAKKGYITIKNLTLTSSKLNYGYGDIPFVRTSDIGNGEIIYPTVHTITEEVYNIYQAKQKMKEYDILFVKDGTYRIGRTAMLFKNDLKALFQSHFKFIRVNKNELIDPFLLYILLQTNIVKEQIDINTFVQATISTIGSRIYNIVLPIPSDEQERKRISETSRDILLNRNRGRIKLFNEKVQLHSDINGGEG